MTVETVEYRVRRGDTLQNIVEGAGFPRRDWRRIYDASYNRAFKRLRPDPDQIEPGDRLMLPRFNQRQIADIMQRIQIVERRFSALSDAVTRMEREIAEAERAVEVTQDLSERDLQRRIDRLIDRAEGLEELAISASGECSDAYSCAGAGAVVVRFEGEARRIRTEAAALRRNVKKGERDALRALGKMRDRLRRYARAQTDTERNVQRLRDLYRRAASNPY